ncbi:hypothetical protein Patl1_28376 [Pistacia atlantica]|uniref:Uncharacterized protein n=1 Tax=Pistacia atlantica TaxID=434234 RepID=A0ACC1BCB4_9ROSI|nr:hypothetical protein Patl1_28376 [Pistacia atlantica]
MGVMGLGYHDVVVLVVQRSTVLVFGFGAFRWRIDGEWVSWVWFNMVSSWSWAAEHDF